MLEGCRVDDGQPGLARGRDVGRRADQTKWANELFPSTMPSRASPCHETFGGIAHRRLGLRLQHVGVEAESGAPLGVGGHLDQRVAASLRPVDPEQQPDPAGAGI